MEKVPREWFSGVEGGDCPYAFLTNIDFNRGTSRSASTAGANPKCISVLMSVPRSRRAHGVIASYETAASTMPE